MVGDFTFKVQLWTIEQLPNGGIVCYLQLKTVDHDIGCGSVLRVNQGALPAGCKEKTYPFIKQMLLSKEQLLAYLQQPCFMLF